MNLTPAERALVQALLQHFRLSLITQLRNPNQLTEDGQAKYRADIELADAIARKLEERVAA